MLGLGNRIGSAHSVDGFLWSSQLWQRGQVYIVRLPFPGSARGRSLRRVYHRGGNNRISSIDTAKSGKCYDCLPQTVCVMEGAWQREGIGQMPWVTEARGRHRFCQEHGI